MPDITYNQFPISGKIVDFDQLQTDVNNLNANAVLESRTINGYDLSANRTIYAQDVPSKNIINPTELVQGSMTSTGTETGGTTRIRSGYVAVTGGTTYTISTSSTTVMIYELHEYNSSKTWQSYTSVSLNSPYTFTTASGTGYVRFLFRYSDNSDILPSAVTNLQLELGSTVTAYVPYAKTNVELTNDYEEGTWTPHLYDYTTKVMNLPTSKYIRIGSLYVCSLYVLNFTPTSAITTMMQIRNLPCPWVIGGNMFIGDYNNPITIQASDVGVYPRNNVTLTASNHGVLSATFIGVKSV